MFVCTTNAPPTQEKTNEMIINEGERIFLVVRGTSLNVVIVDSLPADEYDSLFLLMCVCVCVFEKIVFPCYVDIFPRGCYTNRRGRAPGRALLYTHEYCV